MNVLITSASRKVSLVQAFQVALAKVSPGQVHAADVSSESAALYLADQAHLIPPSAHPDFVSHLIDLCVRQEIGLVIPTRDAALPVFAQHHSAFQAAGIRVMVASSQTVAVCQDKARFNEHCCGHGFSVAAAVDLAVLADDDVDVFVRDRVGQASQNARRIRSVVELRQHLAHTPDAVVQTYIDAPEYTIDLCADFAGRVLSVVPRLRVRLMGGESVVGRTVKNDALKNATCSLAESLNLVGHNTVQAFLVGGVVHFIEVNPRFGGGSSLGFAAGAHTPTTLVRLALGQDVAPRLDAFEEGLTLLRYSQDVFVPGGGLIGDKS